MSLNARKEQGSRRRLGATLVSLIIVVVTMLPMLRFLSGPGIREDWLPLVKPFGYVIFGMSFFWLAKLGEILPGALQEAVTMAHVSLDRLEESDRRAGSRMTFSYFLGIGAGLVLGALNMFAQTPVTTSIAVASFTFLASFM